MVSLRAKRYQNWSREVVIDIPEMLVYSAPPGPRGRDLTDGTRPWHQVHLLQVRDQVLRPEEAGPVVSEVRGRPARCAGGQAADGASAAGRGGERGGRGRSPEDAGRRGGREGRGRRRGRGGRRVGKAGVGLQASGQLPLPEARRLRPEACSQAAFSTREFFNQSGTRSFR